MRGPRLCRESPGCLQKVRSMSPNSPKTIKLLDSSDRPSRQGPGPDCWTGISPYWDWAGRLRADNPGRSCGGGGIHPGCFLSPQIRLSKKLSPFAMTVVCRTASNTWATVHENSWICTDRGHTCEEARLEEKGRRRAEWTVTSLLVSSLLMQDDTETRGRAGSATSHLVLFCSTAFLSTLTRKQRTAEEKKLARIELVSEQLPALLRC